MNTNEHEKTTEYTEYTDLLTTKYTKHTKKASPPGRRYPEESKEKQDVGC